MKFIQKWTLIWRITLVFTCFNLKDVLNAVPSENTYHQFQTTVVVSNLKVMYVLVRNNKLLHAQLIIIAKEKCTNSMLCSHWLLKSAWIYEATIAVDAGIPSLPIPAFCDKLSFQKRNSCIRLHICTHDPLDIIILHQINTNYI